MNNPQSPQTPARARAAATPRRRGAPGYYAALPALGLLSVIILMGGVCGLYRVGPGEAAAIQTFGAARAEPIVSEGLKWHWPWPVGRTTVLETQRSRTATIGFNELPDGKIDAVTGEGWQPDLDSATMITGDLNLIEAQFTAQYVIHNLNDYLFRADDPGYQFEYVDGDRNRVHRAQSAGSPDGQTIRDALEIAIRRAIGQRTIDHALVSDRETIELETMSTAQEILDVYRTGLRLTSVQLQEVKAPDAVQAAFDDVLRAREERDTRINEALAFESKTLPEARGEAERRRRSAEAYQAERVNAAQGEADRFLNILAEYRAAPDVIRKRMRLETLDRVLRRARQILVAAGDAPTLILDAGGGANDDGARRVVVPAPSGNAAPPTQEVQPQ